MSLVDKIWYEKSLSALLLSLPLRPLSWIFAFCTALRRSLYQAGVFKSTAPLIPVIIVGGLSAGGSGKTPLCAALIKELQRRGCRPGLLSRGYHAKCRTFPFRVTADCSASQAGDEPLLIKRQTGAEVVIDPKRERGAFYLAGLGVDVIICDDGMQHYALERDAEIAVIDGVRMFGNRCLLPAGPLREGVWRLKRVDSVVINGAVAQIGCSTMVLRPLPPVPLKPDSHEPLKKGAKVIALGGIGNPDRFYKTLEAYGLGIAGVLRAGDHGRISLAKLKEAAQQAPVVMTAKDAIKYQGAEISNVFVLNVEASLSASFYDNVQELIEHARNKIELRARRQKQHGLPAASEAALQAGLKDAAALASAASSGAHAAEDAEHNPLTQNPTDSGSAAAGAAK